MHSGECVALLQLSNRFAKRGAFPQGVLSVSAALLMLTGCDSDLYDTKEVTSFSAGATLHVANEALIPYSEIKDRLRPEFQLESSVKDKNGKDINSRGNAALVKVLPTTGYFEEQMIRALGAALAVNLATTSTSNKTETKSGGQDGPQVLVHNETKYETGKPPEADKIKAGEEAKPGGAMTAISTMRTGESSRPLTDVPPLLQYNLAAALVQEVALLNKALDHIEQTEGTSYATYVMRLRVAVQPVAPNQPYNALVSLGFFCVPVVGEKPDWTFPPDGRVVKVHPLLVIDDLASTSTARSAQMITQLSLAITGMVGTAGFGGLFSSNTNRIRTLLGKDLDSTFSISRTSDNTVTARLGAPRQPTAGYAMINRNHVVSVVLQIPNDCQLVAINAAATLRHAASGAVVPDPTQPVYDSLRSTLRRYLESSVDSLTALNTAMARVSHTDLRMLADFVRSPDERGFVRFLNVLALNMLHQTPSVAVGVAPEKFAERVTSGWRSLWVAMNANLAASPYQTVSVRVPPPTPKRGSAAQNRSTVQPDPGSNLGGPGRSGPVPLSPPLVPPPSF